MLKKSTRKLSNWWSHTRYMRSHFPRSAQSLVNHGHIWHSLDWYGPVHSILRATVSRVSWLLTRGWRPVSSWCEVWWQSIPSHLIESNWFIIIHYKRHSYPCQKHPKTQENRNWGRNRPSLRLLGQATSYVCWLRFPPKTTRVVHCQNRDLVLFAPIMSTPDW